MPKIKCKCGEIIDLSGIPSPNQHLIISDIEFDDFEGAVDSEFIYSKMKIVVSCPRCKRLHIYYDGFDNAPLIYKLDVDNLSED